MTRTRVRASITSNAAGRTARSDLRASSKNQSAMRSLSVTIPNW